MKAKLELLRGLAQNLGNRARNTALLVATSSPMLAMAQSTDPFDAAVTTVTGKVEGYGAALVGVAAVAIVFAVAAKYVKKIPRAS